VDVITVPEAIVLFEELSIFTMYVVPMGFESVHVNVYSNIPLLFVLFRVACRDVGSASLDGLRKKYRPTRNKKVRSIKSTVATTALISTILRTSNIIGCDQAKRVSFYACQSIFTKRSLKQMDRRDLFNLSPYSNPPWGGSTWTYVHSPGGVYRTDLRHRELPSPEYYPPGSSVLQRTWDEGSLMERPYFRADTSREDSSVDVGCGNLPPPYIIPNVYRPSGQELRWNTPTGTVTSTARPIDSTSVIPPGYNPKRHNPGGLKFSMYEYNDQTQGGIPLQHPGRGWYRYENTGELPGNRGYDSRYY